MRTSSGPDARSTSSSTAAPAQYICGEETALLDALEGKRGNPRLKPPFPAIQGLYGGPTLINNVETLMNVPIVVNNGAEWYKGFGTEQSTGTKVVSVSGCVKRPGNYEIELGIPAREIIYGLAGGPIDGDVKAWYPGGSSAPVLGPEELDLPYSFEALADAKSMLGSGAIIVADQSVSIPHMALRTARFYHHESCGKCTPCREGTNWTVKMLERVVRGEATPMDLDIIASVQENIIGNCLCVLGDAMAMPVGSMVRRWRGEFEEAITPSPGGRSGSTRRRAGDRHPGRRRRLDPVPAGPPPRSTCDSYSSFDWLPMEGRVKGIVFNLIEEIVVREHGDDTWDALLDGAELNGAYTSLGNYDDAELVALVGAASTALDLPADEVVRWFGRNAFPMLAGRVNEQMQSYSTMRSFVLSLNEIIHPEVRKLYPGATPPNFVFDASSDDRLILDYDSRRGLCAFAEGLLSGAGEYFGEDVRIDQPLCMHRGDDVCRLVITTN